MNVVHIILILGIVLVIIYDFTNGFHDAADMIATAIASNTTTPGRAIILVSFFTLLGPLLGGVAVANTIGQFVEINPHQTTIAQTVVISALLSAITYNLVTWKLGLPSSSSSSLTVKVRLEAVGQNKCGFSCVAICGVKKHLFYFLQKRWQYVGFFSFCKETLKLAETLIRSFGITVNF